MNFLKSVIRLMDSGLDAETACREVCERDDNYVYDENTYE